MKGYFGQFQLQSDQRHPVLVTNSGEKIAVDVTRKPMVPLNEPLSVTLDGRNLVEYRRDQSAPAPARSTHTVDAFVWMKESFEDGDQALIDDRAKRVTDAYNRSFQGHLTMEAEGFLVDLTEDLSIDLHHEPTWRALRELVGPRFTHIHIIGGRSGYCGLARVSSNRAITYNYPQCRDESSFHEKCHNIGLRHAFKNGREYQERDRIMGTGNGRRWISAPHLWQVGALDENHVAEFLPGEKERAYLVGFNTLELAVPSGAKRLLLLRQPTDKRLVAVSLDEGRLDIHVPVLDNSASFMETDLVATLNRSQSFEVAGRTIEFLDYKDGVASVAIDGAALPQRWPEYPAVDSLGFDDCLGAWGNPHWGAQGLHILPADSPGRIRVVWVTWDYEYNTFWMAGNLTIVNGIATGTLDNGRDTAEAIVVLTDDHNGLFRARFGHERFATPLRRVSRASASTWIEHQDGSFETQEVATNGVEFGYKLQPARRVGHQRTGPKWQMVQDGEALEISGGMRGVNTETISRGLQ